MTQPQARCLILACGNTLRGDDGVGPWLAEWAEKQFEARGDVRVISRHQWTPELAEDVAGAESILFLDCAADLAPGSIRLLPVGPAADVDRLGTHHVGAAELLGLAHALCGSLPRTALLLTVGAGSIELGEDFSDAVKAALPETCALLQETVLWLAGNSKLP